MDLLFSKYASPFLFVEQVMSLNRLSEFVDEIMNLDNENKMWQLYLSCLSNPYSEVGSFNEFKEKIIRPVKNNDIDLEATVKNSFDVLKDFKP